MATQVQFRGGTTAEHSTFTGASREVTVDTDKETLVVHDGSTAGGFPVLRQDGSNSAFALGSAASPSLKWDANTGIYSPGADQIAISTGGAGRLFVDADGNIGIGGAATSKLTVTGGNLEVTGPTYNYVQVQATGGAQGHFSSNGSDSIGLRAVTNHPLAFYTNNSERLRITSDGNVGINTASPAARLSTNNGIIYVGNTDGTSDSRIEFQQTDGANFPSSWIGQPTWSKSVLYFYGPTTTGSELAALYGNSTWAFSTGGFERARIDSSGRLLVGTSTSGLSYANIQVVGGAGGASSGNIRLSSTDATPGSSSDLGGVRFTDSNGGLGAQLVGARDGGTWTSGSSHPSKLVFSTCASGASSPTERMRITNTGRLYIGTTTGTIDTANFGTAIYASGYFNAGGNFNGTQELARWFGNAGSVRIMGDGDLENTNNSYGALSDIKLKENVVNADSQWDDIKALQVRKYNLKAETGYSTHTQIGLVAQEVELVSPGLVGASADRDADGNDLGTVTKSVNYSVLYMKAVKALQEAMERIELLEAKVAALESA